MNESKVRSFTLRPPPGTRFSIHGSDCVLQFERGREGDVCEWLINWIANYLAPFARGVLAHGVHEDGPPKAILSGLGPTELDDEGAISAPVPQTPITRPDSITDDENTQST
jgi:hypothetical protein